jgi:prophage regulatory protein
VRFVRPREVLEMIGVSRTTLWRMVQSGAFPPPVRITTRNNGFVLEAVEEWMKARTLGRAWEPPAQPESQIRLDQLAGPRAASGTSG